MCCGWRRRMLETRSGDFAQAPWHVIPGGGLQQTYGQWGSSGPAIRTPLGAALFVPCRPRDRMGLRAPARQHARYQRQWHVYRSRRSVVGWRRIYRAIGSPAAIDAGLFRETHRAGAGDGRYRGARGIGKSEALPRSCFLTLQHWRLTLFYTGHDDALP